MASGEPSGEGGSSSLALPAPTVLVDALPYIDGQYNDPTIKAQVHALIAEEMKTFKPEKDYLEGMEDYEPDFEPTQLLQSEWMRVSEGAPMSKMDTSRYQLDAPPPSLQRDPAEWKRAVDNAKAQLENQATRLTNLELLQAHGAKLWVAQCASLEGSANLIEKTGAEMTSKIDALNRKRKAEQLQAAPALQSMQSEWVGLVKKNLEIESQTLVLEAECAALREKVEARKRGGPAA